MSIFARTALCLFTLAAAPAAAAAQPPLPQPLPPAAEPTPSDPVAEPPVADEGVAVGEPNPAAPEDEDPSVKVTYDNGLVAESANEEFEMKINLRTQTRFEAVRKDSIDDWQNHFVIPRLRFQLEGHAWGEDTTYKSEFDFSNRGNPILKDFYVDHAFYMPFQDVHVRGGQWKKPFARHELVSDFGSEFNERALANGLVDIGRDLGLAIHNGYDKSPDGLEWAVGVFNGTGDADRSPSTLSCDDPDDARTCTPSTPSNTPTDLDTLLVAHVGWNMGGIKGYTEADLEGGPLRLSVGLSYQADFNDFNKDLEGDLLVEHGAVLDGLVKYEGIDVQAAAYMLKRGSADPDYSYLGQAGYMIVPKKYQVAARYSLTPAGSDDDVQELLGAFTWFFKGQNFKWATDAGIIKASASDTTDIQVRSQIQALF